jgi:hypothetical protein
MTSEELAAVQRDMDAILAAAAAEGQLDEQFGQLLSLQVRAREIWEGGGGRRGGPDLAT